MELNQFLIGSYLGDASFVKKSPSHNTYIVFKHAEDQLEYLNWKYRLVKSYGLTDEKHKGVVEVKLKEGSCFPNHQRQFKFATMSSYTLNEYKTMSEVDILDQFGEESFVIWLLDDGNVYKNRVKISCGDKSKEFCLQIVDKLLWDFGFDCYYYEHPSNPSKNYIVIRSVSYEDVKKMVLKYVPSDLDVVRRKFNNTLNVLVKYHSDIHPLEFVNGNSDWIDLRAAEDVEMKAGEAKCISLGVSMKLLEGYEAVIIPRSSTFKHWGILQTNHFGLIDNSYCGDNDVWMFPALATRDVLIEKNSRICQFRIQKKMENVMFKTVDKLEDVDRGGFGSSGKV